jgi:hypothetical protein
MEALAAIGLVGNIVQFVDFSQKLISKSIQLYHSCDGALAENTDIEIATKNLLILNKKLKDDATTVDDGALQSLCHSCHNAGIDLLMALNKVKVKDRQQPWESVRKALQSVWNKKKIKALEQRLAKFKEDLNLLLVKGLRYVKSSRSVRHANNISNTESKSLSSSRSIWIVLKISTQRQRASSMLLSSDRMSFKQHTKHSLC